MLRCIENHIIREAPLQLSQTLKEQFIYILTEGPAMHLISLKDNRKILHSESPRRTSVFGVKPVPVIVSSAPPDKKSSDRITHTSLGR